MSVFKPFVSSDVTVSPFEVNKTFTFNGVSELTNGGIDRLEGQNSTSSLWVSGSNPTGTIDSYNKFLVYRSIRELYYSNFIGNPDGAPTSVPSFNTDGTITGEPYTPSYYNYLSTTLPPERYYPTGSDEKICVYSIPSNKFGESIKPNSFRLQNETDIIEDRGEGILYYNNNPMGSIIYEHGIVILTEGEVNPGSLYGGMIYGSGVYSVPPFTKLGSFITGSNITCSFESTTTIFESQYKCTIRQNEFTFSQNPTLISGSSNSGIVSDFATGSYFNPYVTTVGLYNNANELLAVAKLAKPLPISQTTDTNIIINLDL